MDARAALGLIPEGSGLTLEACVRMALQLQGPVAEAVTVAEAVDRFLREQLARVAPSTWDFYEQHLRALEAGAGPMALGEINRRWLKGYFEGLSASRPQRWRAVRRLLKWAVAEHLLPTFPAEGFSIAQKRTATVEVLTAEEARKVLEQAGIYTAALAAMLLAGVRPYEVRGPGKPPMHWGQIDFRGRTIRIEASQAKTGVGRVLEGKLPEALWVWLKVGRRILQKAGRGHGQKAPVCPYAIRQAYDVARGAAGRWKADILRHTFASAHVAHYGDLTATSLLLGHEGSLRTLHRHYRGRMTQVDAEHIFGR